MIIYRLPLGSNFLIVFENINHPAMNATKLIDGEVYELSNQHHVWINRNGAPKKYVRELVDHGKQTGWFLHNDHGITIARAGKSLLPTDANDWKYVKGNKSDASIQIVVQEYKSKQLAL